MPNVAELIKEHVSLTVDCVNRPYSNAYVPRFQAEGGVVVFLRNWGQVIPSPALFGQSPTGSRRVSAPGRTDRGSPGTKSRRGNGSTTWCSGTGLVAPTTTVSGASGVAQDKARRWTATKEARGHHAHFRYHWKTVCMNHYYLYVEDREWSPAFLMICRYPPYVMKLCLNGHEWAKRQCARHHLPITAPDNAFRSYADPTAFQTVGDRLGPAGPAASFGYRLSLL